MTNEFLVLTREIGLVEEADFLTHGGEELHFGSVVDGTVRLVAQGTADSIGRLARMIKAHHTAAAHAALGQTLLR